MRYEILSIKGFVNEIKEVSSGPHSRKFCFVLGAGASRSSGIKSGQELVNIWDRELSERNEEEHARWRQELGITEENKDSFYSRYYEMRFRRHPADGYNYLEKLMEHAKPSIGYVMLSYLLAETKHNVVITTNFDHLTEDAVNYYTQTIPLIIGHESLAHYITKQINRPTIVKIHRDLLFDPKNRTDELEVLHDNWKKALSNIFSEYHPIFIGYAGNDNSLMDFLVENSEKFRNGTWAFPYWMTYQTEEIGGKVLQFLDGAEGYLIRHEGFDEVMYLLGAAFEYKLPPEEEFLSDARKRFQTLSNYIDDFTEKLLNKQETLPKKEGSEETSGDVAENSPEISQAIWQITSHTERQRKYREAVELNNSGNYEEAVKIKQELIEQEPENARYYNSLGISLHELKRYEEALEAKKRAVELEPENARYNNSLGTTLHAMKYYNEALEAKEKAVELEPENALYHDSLSVTLHVMKQYEEAAEEARKAVELEPENARYHDSLSKTLHAMEQYEEAAEEARKTVELEPENAEYHSSLGATLHAMKHYNEALEAKKRAIELEPKNARYHDNLSTTLHEMEQYEEAVEEARKAVELEPENARYHNSLGITLHEMGRYEDALAAKQKAVELEPDNKKYRESLEITQKAINAKEK